MTTDSNLQQMVDEGTPLRDILAYIRTTLAPKYGDGEAREMGRIIFENLKGWTPVDLAIKADEKVTDYICEKVRAVVGRLLKDEPIQLIFGNTRFYGLQLKVTADTLIPRPETAELVDIIVKENRLKDLRVLDCGTGSGCIAIALSRNLPFADVTAIDVSDKALDVARENARTLRAAIDFRHADILRLPDGVDGPFDIIVSNPPYVAEREKADMEANVLQFEPATALFVPDNDPLRFYLPILDAATDGLLAAGGRVYFELNPLFAADLKKAAESRGYADVRLIRDSDGKVRFLAAQLPG